MKNTLLVLLISFLMLGTLEAQTYIYPAYGSRSHANVDVTRVKLTETYSMVEMEVNVPTSGGNLYQETSWVVCMKKETYLRDRDNGKKYYIKRVDNVPMCPQDKVVPPGQKLRFRLYFDALPKTTKQIDIVEEAENSNDFSFFKILLFPIA